ncbi:hypothetical protein Hanom_Chr11g00967761 [Helianthus anomalus]
MYVNYYICMYIRSSATRRGGVNVVKAAGWQALIPYKIYPLILIKLKRLVGLF